MLKACKEHTHKADTREIGNRTNPSFIFFQRNTELIPRNRFSLSISQWHACIALIYNEIIPYYHIIWTQRNMILVILFIFI